MIHRLVHSDISIADYVEISEDLASVHIKIEKQMLKTAIFKILLNLEFLFISVNITISFVTTSEAL